MMNSTRLKNFALTLALGSALVGAFVYATTPDKPADKPAQNAGKYFKPDEVQTDGSVGTEGGRVNYTAVAGTLVVHAKNWDDVPSPKDADKDDKEAASQNP